MNSKDSSSEEDKEMETKGVHFEVDYGQNNTNTDSKLNPLRLKAMLMKADHKSRTSHHQHQKRRETIYRSLSSRYTNLLVDDDDDDDDDDVMTLMPQQKIQMEESTTTTGWNVNTKRVEKLAKKLTHLRISMALDKRKSKTSIYDMPNPIRSETRGKVDIEMLKKLARHRWQVAIGLVMGMANMATHSPNDESGPFTVGDLIFDPAIFKASKCNVVLSADSKFILTQLPEKRSNDQVEEVAKDLLRMGIKMFKDYPPWMQRNLLKIAHYEVVTSQRVIIRQGQPAENLFFLLEGTLVVIERVCIFDKANYSEDLVILRKGAMFGEADMVNNLNRRATVISKGDVELLRIERDEIINMLTFRHRLDEPFDHITFLRRCKFITSWPMERFTDNPGCCMPYFFKQNALIVEDSFNTDFLVVVRSGECRVICKLYKNMFPTDETTGMRRKSGRSKLVEYDAEILRKNFPTFSRHDSQFDAVFGIDSFENMLKGGRSPPNQNEDPPAAVTEPRDIQRLVDEQKSVTPRRVSRRSLRHRSSSKRKTTYQQSSPTIDFDRVANRDKAKKQIIKLEAYSSKTKLERALLLPNTQEHLLERIEKDKENAKIAVYIQLDTLKEKDVFGLETLVFDKSYDNPNGKGLCLVSGEDGKGVGIVLVSKSLFIKYASEEVAWRARRMMKVYPDHETLFDEIERQKLWGSHKDLETGVSFTGKPLLLRNNPWK